MNKFEQQFNNSELQPNAQVQVVAYLDDISGKRYFLKTSQRKYFLLNEDLEQYEEVPEVAVASAILKHGYKPLSDGQLFEFSKRKEVLNKHTL